MPANRQQQSELRRTASLRNDSTTTKPTPRESKATKMRNAYRVEVLPDRTSQAAVRRIKRHRPATIVRRIVAALILTTMSLGGFVAVAGASLTTAQLAHADIITDMFCVQATSGGGAGSWGDKNARFGNLGGYTASMESLTKNTKPDRVTNPAENTVAKDVNYKLTAFEKYGSNYPVFETWTPAFADKSFSFAGVNAKGGLGSGDKIPAGSTNGSEPITANSSRMIANDMGSCINFLGNTEVAIANVIATPPRLLLNLANTAYTSAVDVSLTNPDSPLHGVLQKVDELVSGQGGLRDTLFVPFMIPLILIGAIWIGWVGLVKRQTMIALQSTAWMIIAVALGAFFLAQPSFIAKQADNLVAGVQSVINDSFPVVVDTDSMCSATGPATSKRSAACMMWKASIYDVWAEGQFGGFASDTTDPRGILKNPAYPIHYGNKTVTATSWPQLQLDRQATGMALQTSEVAYAELSGNGVGSGIGGNPSWAGADFNNVTAAITMWATVTVYSIVPLVLALLQLLYQLIMVVALIMSPVFFLFGIVPSWGKRILLRFAEILASLVVKRIITTLFLATYFFLFSLVTSTGMVILLQTIVVAIIAIFTLVWRMKFTNMLMPSLNFGGNKTIGLPGGRIAAGAAGVGGAAVGLAAGGLLGSILGGVGASKAVRGEGKDIEGKGEMNLFRSSPTSDIRVKPPVRQMINDGQRMVKTTQKLSSGNQSPASAAEPPASTVTAMPEAAAPQPPFPQTTPQASFPSSQNSSGASGRLTPTLKSPEFAGTVAGAATAATGAGAPAAGAVKATVTGTASHLQNNK